MTSVVHLFKESSVPDLKLFQDQRTAGLSSLKKNQNQRTVGPVISKTFENLWFSRKNQQ